MLALAFSGCDHYAAIFFLTAATAANGAVSTGALASMVDISPNFASIVLGINGVVTVLPGFISPIVVGALTYQNVSWRWPRLLCCWLLLWTTAPPPPHLASHYVPLALQQTVEQWQIVFGVTAAMLFVTGAAYVAFGRSEVQPWNEAPEPESSADGEDEKTESSRTSEMRPVC